MLQLAILHQHLIAAKCKKKVLGKDKKEDQNPAAWLILKGNSNVSTETATLALCLWCMGIHFHLFSFLCCFSECKSILVIKSKLKKYLPASSWVAKACFNSFKLLHPIYWRCEISILRTAMLSCLKWSS